MNRGSLLEEGVICEDPSVVKDSHGYISRAWQSVVKAREAYLECEWADTDHWARDAAINATTAMLSSRGYRPVGDLSVRDARRYCFQSFSVMGDHIFTRVGLIGEFLPLPKDLAPKENSLMRKTVAASSELVALIECHIAVERDERERIERRVREAVAKEMLEEGVRQA